jgi:hypothetical protein
MENEFLIKPNGSKARKIHRGMKKYKYDDYTSVSIYIVGPLINIWRFKKDRMYSIEIRWHHNGL